MLATRGITVLRQHPSRALSTLWQKRTNAWRTHLFAVNTRARLTKLPRLASSSLLRRARMSLHLKSVSLTSGRLLSR